MKKWLAVTLLAISCVVAGCATDLVDTDSTASKAESLVSTSAADPSSDPATAAPDTAEALAARRCCSDGSFSCPTDAGIIEFYDLPGCGTLRPTARAACNSQCGHPCVDSGWGPSGLCEGPEFPPLPPFDPFPHTGL